MFDKSKKVIIESILIYEPGDIFKKSRRYYTVIKKENKNIVCLNLNTDKKEVLPIKENVEKVKFLEELLNNNNLELFERKALNFALNYYNQKSKIEERKFQYFRLKAFRIKTRLVIEDMKIMRL